MRIKITSGGKTTSLLFPTSLILNPISFSLTRGEIKIDNVGISGLKAKNASKILKVIKSYKKENPDWNLLEIESADGDGVIIQL